MRNSHPEGFPLEPMAALRKEIQQLISAYEELGSLSFQNDLESKLVLFQRLHHLPMGVLSVDHRRELQNAINGSLSHDFPLGMVLKQDPYALHLLILFVHEVSIAEVDLSTKRVSFHPTTTGIHRCNDIIQKAQRQLLKMRPKRLDQLVHGRDVERYEKAVTENEEIIYKNEKNIERYQEYKSQVLQLCPIFENAGFNIIFH